VRGSAWGERRCVWSLHDTADGGPRGPPSLNRGKSGMEEKRGAGDAETRGRLLGDKQGRSRGGVQVRRGGMRENGKVGGHEVAVRE
jgi:hypothetical protein